MNEKINNRVTKEISIYCKICDSIIWKNEILRNVKTKIYKTAYLPSPLHVSKTYVMLNMKLEIPPPIK